MNIVTEAQKQLIEIAKFDVAVCGGGPAGVSAAIASARSGAKTCLIETNGFLGGIWTAGQLCWIIDADNKDGIMTEIKMGLEERNARSTKGAGDFAYEAEEMKQLLDEMCIEAGVHIYLYTRVTAVIKEEDMRISHVITESKSGRQAIRANVFIDTTGDGDLGAFAGCGFDYGKEETGETQPVSLGALIVGLNFHDVRNFLVNGGTDEESSKKVFLKELQKHGINPSYGAPSLAYLSGNIFSIAINHEYGVSALDATQLTQATIRARKETFHTIHTLKASKGVWENLQIVSTNTQIGVRDGRRIHGVYRLTKEDLIMGKEQPDAICKVTFGVDVHALNPANGKGYSDEGIRSKPYDIPMRALVSKDVKNLLMAGRCISGDFIAHASYRVTGNAVAMGQAAGIIGATATFLQKDVANITIEEVNPLLDKLKQLC